jgi:hypothetical protein
MRGLSCLSTMAGLLALASIARAQPATCIPAARGVPWLPGPPTWWPGSTQFMRSAAVAPDDPRWVGAFQHAFAFAGLPSETRMRIVADADDLYFGVWSERELTSVAIGFVAEDQAGTPQRLIVLKLIASLVPGPTSNTPRQLLEYGRWNATTGRWQLLASTLAVPPGADAGVDAVNDQVIEWGNALVGANTAARVMHWRVNRSELEERLMASIDGARFWAGVVRTGRVGTAVNNYPDVWPPASASNATLTNLLGSSGMAAPASIALPASNASLFGYAGAGCSGVALDPNGIFIEHADGSRNTTVHVPSSGAPTDDYVALPNYAGFDPPLVQGVFRLARWGSQTSTRSAAAWQPIGPLTGPSDRWVASSTSDIRLTDCSATDCPPPMGAQDEHQCLLVELRKDPGRDESVTFVRDSAYQNLEFASVNSFRREGVSRQWVYRDRFRIAAPDFNDPEALGRAFRYQVTFDAVGIPGLGGVPVEPDEDLAAFLDAPYESAGLQTGPALIASVQREELDSGDETGATQVPFAYVFELPEPGLEWRLSVLDASGSPIVEGTDQPLTIDLLRGDEGADLELVLESLSSSLPTDPAEPDEEDPLPVPRCSSAGASGNSRATPWALGTLLLAAALRRQRAARTSAR